MVTEFHAYTPDHLGVMVLIMIQRVQELHDESGPC